MAQYDEAELMLDVLDRIGDHGFPNWASEAAALIRTQAARIAELEGERDEYAAHVVEFSETAAELIEEMSKRPQSTWGQVKAAVRALGDIGDRRAYGKIKTRAEAAEARERALLACNNEERKALVQIVSLKSRLKAAEAALAEAEARSAALVAKAYEDVAKVAERFTECCQSCAGIGLVIRQHAANRALAQKEAGE